MAVPDSNVSSGTGIILGQCNESQNQQWYMDSSGRIHSGLDYSKCIQLQTDGSIGISDCQKISSGTQKWTWASDGHIHLQGDVDTCIDGNMEGQVIHTLKCSFYNANDQIWYPSPAPSISPTLAFKTIRSAALLGNLCIEIPRSNTANGNTLILNQCSDKQNQQWQMDSDGRIHSGLDYNKCLQLQDLAMLTGASIEVSDCHEKSYRTQKWTWTADGHIHLQADTDICIDGNWEGQVIHALKCSFVNANDQIWF